MLYFEIYIRKNRLAICKIYNSTRIQGLWLKSKVTVKTV